MLFKQVNGSDLKTSDTKEVATEIFNFFLWQYEEASNDAINARCEKEAFKSANIAAGAAYRNDPEYTGLGWGPKLPYTEYQLKRKEEESERAEKNVKDHKTILNFIRDRFVDGFVENKTL